MLYLDIYVVTFFIVQNLICIIAARRLFPNEYNPYSKESHIMSVSPNEVDFNQTTRLRNRSVWTAFSFTAVVSSKAVVACTKRIKLRPHFDM